MLLFKFNRGIDAAEAAFEALETFIAYTRRTQVRQYSSFFLT